MALYWVTQTNIRPFLPDNFPNSPDRANRGVMPSLLPSHHYSFSNVLTSVPMCGRISTENVSPCLRVTFGFLPTPTPAGVPVMMTVPGCRVVPCERKLTSSGTLKMRSLFDTFFQ